MKKLTLRLTSAEYEHITITMEGAREELEEMEHTYEWFSSLLIERIAECLTILRDAHK